jgi:transposase-like protein
LLLDLKRRGLAIGPELAVADGALGFWQAVEQVWPQIRGHRCWVHKTANVLNKLPKSQHSKAKRALQEIWMAETKKDALAAFDVFVETWGVKYDKAVECLIKDRMRCRPSTTSRPSIGSIYARAVSLKARLRRFVTAPYARRDVSRTRPR